MRFVHGEWREDATLGPDELRDPGADDICALKLQTSPAFMRIERLGKSCVLIVGTTCVEVRVAV